MKSRSFCSGPRPKFEFDIKLPQINGKYTTSLSGNFDNSCYFLFFVRSKEKFIQDAINGLKSYLIHKTLCEKFSTLLKIFAHLVSNRNGGREIRYENWIIHKMGESIQGDCRNKYFIEDLEVNFIIFEKELSSCASGECGYRFRTWRIWCHFYINTSEYCTFSVVVFDGDKSCQGQGSINIWLTAVGS